MFPTLSIGGEFKSFGAFVAIMAFVAIFHVPGESANAKLGRLVKLVELFVVVSQRK